jgi:predicted Zn-dependent protease
MIAASCLIVAAAVSVAAAAAPLTPTRDDQQLERLPRGSVRIGAELRDLRGRSAELASAERLAQKYVRLGADESDPRYFGYAAAALAPWWGLSAPPPEARLLRAMVLQNRHAFDGALADLDAVSKADPANLQAWLMRAAILKLLGRFDEARASCAPLAASSDPLLAVGCLGDVASLLGASGEAADALERAIGEGIAAPPERRRWSATLLAEIAARRGEAQRAERYFKMALEAAKPTAYLLSAYADFLLDEGRCADVAALLADTTRMDAALLRLALAEQRMESEGLAEHVAAIAERFSAGRRRGEAFHLGDEARFALFLQRDPAKAIGLAQENWRVQRAPADARILFEAAIAAGEAEVAGPARAFLQRAGWDEPRLARLADAARAAAAPSGGR